MFISEAKMQEELKEIVLCTGNKNKLKEFMQILGPDFPYKVIETENLSSFPSVLNTCVIIF